MISANIMTYVAGIFSIIIGALGLYSRAQSHKIKSLGDEIKDAEGRVTAANKVARINQAKAELHKDVARTVVQNSTVSKEKVKQVQEKIDAINNDEDFIVTF